MKSRRARLVIQHLEGTKGAALDEYPKVIREFIRGKNGVYALYKKDRLYYVGLAKNLRSRLRHHLNDRHAGKWDRFSIYLTETDEHLKELESLVLRIAEPRGNKVAGKFIGSEDLKRKFKRRLKESWSRKFEDLTDWAEPEPQRRPKRFKAGVNELAKYVTKRFHIRLRHKGKQYVAHVLTDGRIAFARESPVTSAVRKVKYPSPSAAAAAVTGHSMNGWAVWHFWSTMGELVSLDALRTGKAKPRF